MGPDQAAAVGPDQPAIPISEILPASQVSAEQFVLLPGVRARGGPNPGNDPPPTAHLRDRASQVIGQRAGLDALTCREPQELVLRRRPGRRRRAARRDSQRATTSDQGVLGPPEASGDVGEGKPQAGVQASKRSVLRRGPPHGHAHLLPVPRLRTARRGTRRIRAISGSARVRRARRGRSCGREPTRPGSRLRCLRGSRRVSRVVFTADHGIIY